MKIFHDLTGKKFGKLTPIKYMQGGKWKCRCECGNVVIKIGANVRNGNTSTCGEYPCCRWPKHGLSKTPEWNTWRGMIERCENPKHEKFRNYGGRGIGVYGPWHDFEVFFKYVGRKPTTKHSLDRFPNKDGNYEPGNVRWATQRQQCRNTAKNTKYTAFGKTLCMVEWAEEAGMSVQTLSWRLHQCQMPIERALGPVRQLR